MILGAPGVVILVPFSKLFWKQFWEAFPGCAGEAWRLVFVAMKMKVRLLSPWPSSEVVFGVKMGLQLGSKMLPKLV